MEASRYRSPACDGCDEYRAGKSIRWGTLRPPPRGWFVTGTDTGVGKTCVAAALLRALVQSGGNAVGMKPVASGCRETPEGLRSADAEALVANSSIVPAYSEVNPYAFLDPVAPHLAAAARSVSIRVDVIRAHFDRLARRASWMVVEGAGGWRVPLNEAETMADLARALGLPVLLVVGLRLGCLNHALLTVEAIRADGIPLAGWVANAIDPATALVQENIATLSRRIAAPLLATVPHGSSDDHRERIGRQILNGLISG